MKIKEIFSKDGILICFNGSFTHGIIEEIGNAIRSHLEEEHLGRDRITDVFAVYVEQTQNVRNYLKNRDLSIHVDSTAIMLIVQSGSDYMLCSGNIIVRKDVDSLREKLEKINSLDKMALKTMYKEELKKQRTNGAEGAGVGLIDIARRASGKLDYRFDRKDDHHDFFSLYVNVAGGQG